MEKTDNKLTSPIQAIDTEGWMKNDENVIVKIDQYYIDPRGHLIIHAIDIEEDGDEEYYIGWYDCLDNIQIPPRLYSSSDECKKNEDAIKNFEEAKRKSEHEAEKNRVFNELNNYSQGEIERYLEEEYDRVVRDKGNLSEGVYRSAIAAFRTGYIKIELTKSGMTNIPLCNIDRVSENGGKVTITTKQGFEFSVSKGSEVYEVLHIMYIENMYRLL